jgi:hypothetical protein
LKSLRIDNLPWVNFRRSIGSQCKLNLTLIISFEISDGSNSFVVKPVNFSFDLAELACQFSIISSDAPSPSDPSFGLELFEDLGNEWLAQVPPPAPRRPQRSFATENGPFVAFDTREPLVLMTSALNHFTARVAFPEDYRGELRTEWELQLGLSDPDPVVHLLKTFV